jgi:hypothetical protein
MKEYRLASWPELPANSGRTAHRRLLSAMSQRHQSIAQLVECSGLKRTEVMTLVERLEMSGHVTSREVDEPTSTSGWRPLGGWLRRAFDGAGEGH